ncbi:FAD-dependent oxidoreductase, partial [bacterium]|nr:FAD-dependent oxidoreductase [bacterium]
MFKNGYREIELKLPTDYDEVLIIKNIQKKLGLKKFDYKILKKSLDARKKNKIVYLLKIGVFSPEIKGSILEPMPALNIIRQTRKQKIIVVGNGPAGFFCAYALAKAGFSVTVLEQGCALEQRVKDIESFEQTGVLKANSNYVFGEGGAGTFSDGKLTTRTKNITAQKAFVLDTLIQAGAPAEINYLNHPHLGSDNLKRIVKNLRAKFQDLGGQIIFETKVLDFRLDADNKVTLITKKEAYTTDYVFFAPGNSAYDTYKMLLKNNLEFNTKPFAIGVRVEHLQTEINQAQWQTPALNGVKAA